MNSPTSIDVRLQYVAGGWALRTGDSQYDQDHRGYWGSSSVMANLTPADAIELTMQLINEVLEGVCESQ